MFTDKEHRGPFEFSDELGNLSIGTESTDTGVPGHRVEANDKDLLLSTSEEEETRVPSNNGAYNAPSYDSSLVSIVASQPQSDLLSTNTMVPSSASQSSFAIDNLLGLGVSATPAPAPAPSPPPLNLNPKAALDPSTFQQKWRQLPISSSQVYFANYSYMALNMPVSTYPSSLLYFQLNVSRENTSVNHFMNHEFAIWEASRFQCDSLL